MHIRQLANGRWREGNVTFIAADIAPLLREKSAKSRKDSRVVTSGHRATVSYPFPLSFFLSSTPFLFD